MFGDQQKAWIKRDIHTPVSMPPGLWILRVAMGLLILASIVTATFGWTWLALVAFVAVAALGVALTVRIRSRRRTPRSETAS